MKPGFLAALIAALVRFFMWLGGQAERVKLEKEQEEAANAQREDFDRIANDGRSPDDAISKLRARAKARDGGVP